MSIFHLRAALAWLMAGLAGTATACGRYSVSLYEFGQLYYRDVRGQG